MEIYIIDKEGNVKERYGNVNKHDGLEIFDNKLYFHYTKYQVPIEEQKKWKFHRNLDSITGDFIEPQEAPTHRVEIDLTKEEIIRIIF